MARRVLLMKIVVLTIMLVKFDRVRLEFNDYRNDCLIPTSLINMSGTLEIKKFLLHAESNNQARVFKPGICYFGSICEELKQPKFCANNLCLLDAWTMTKETKFKNSDYNLKLFLVHSMLLVMNFLLHYDKVIVSLSTPFNNQGPYDDECFSRVHVWVCSMNEKVHAWFGSMLGGIMFIFKLPSKFHEYPNECGRTFGVSIHLFGQETPLGSYMHPVSEPRQSIWLPKLHIHSSTFAYT
ncbi:hypothetical protein PVK06_039860 [Gossypium arboreum]|uniref:Uncharacterized protein n=1 Tax=Gossypium arboreum TaxID=29729 RepID=A0ABR0N402_GOSAR|nr:hypothetical protein PVK06_039860 [Gossypium arboreum]